MLLTSQLYVRTAGGEHDGESAMCRSDSDAYFNPVEFWRVRHELPQSRLVMGRFEYTGRVRASLHQQYFRIHQYSPYPLGLGFIFSYDVAEWLALSSIPLIISSPEDAVVGMWLQGMQLNLVSQSDNS